MGGLEIRGGEPPATAANLESAREYPGAGCDAEGGKRLLLSWNHLVQVLPWALARYVGGPNRGCGESNAQLSRLSLSIPRSPMDDALSVQHLTEMGNEL